MDAVAACLGTSADPGQIKGLTPGVTGVEQCLGATLQVQRQGVRGHDKQGKARIRPPDQEWSLGYQTLAGPGWQVDDQGASGWHEQGA